MLRHATPPHALPRLTRLLLVTPWLITAAPTWAASSTTSDDEPHQWTLVQGSYQMVGRHPDSTRSYAGSAHITRQGNKLVLVRQIDGKTTRREGVIRRAMPGEAMVLAIRWDEAPTAGQKITARDMVCSIHTDLDNYPRLSCLWGLPGNPHRQPGLESYFSSENW